MESAGEPIFSMLLFGLFVPAITKITSFSNWIWSKAAASAEIKLSFTSWLLPNEIFQTLISLFSATILLIFFTIENEEKFKVM